MIDPVVKEERRQKLLEVYGIGVSKWRYKSDKGIWFGEFRLEGEDYETENYATRREAEDKAIILYETILKL